MDLSNKTTQFLMGLNESFDIFKSQIMMQDPLPSINNAYAMLQTIEANAMMIREENGGKKFSSKGDSRRKHARRKIDIVTIVNSLGYTKETYFKINGIQIGI